MEIKDIFSRYLQVPHVQVLFSGNPIGIVMNLARSQRNTCTYRSQNAREIINYPNHRLQQNVGRIALGHVVVVRQRTDAANGMLALGHDMFPEYGGKFAKLAERRLKFCLFG